MTRSRTLRRRDGRFAGSVGAGKTRTPAVRYLPELQPRTPAWTVTVERGSGWAMMVEPSGRVFIKQFDAYGIGAGSRTVGPVGRWLHRRAIRNAIASTHAAE